MTQGYTLSADSIRQLKKVVREWYAVWKNEQTPVPYYGQVRDTRRQAILQSDLLAAVNTLTDRSTALAELLQLKTNGDLETTGQVVTVVNPFQEISIDAGTYIKIEWIDGEWQPYAADCPAQSASMSMSMSGSASESASNPPPGGP